MLVLTSKRQVQSHYDYAVLILHVSFSHLENSASTSALRSALAFQYEPCLLCTVNHLQNQKLVLCIFRNAFNSLQYFHVS